MWFSTKYMAQQNAELQVRIGNLPDDLKQDAIEEALEKNWFIIQKCVLSFKAGSNILKGGRFDTTSLGTWMEIVKACDLTYVPIHMVGLIEDVSTVLKTHTFALNIPEELLQYKGMVRIDNCGSNEVKAEMSYRAGIHNKRLMGATLDHPTQTYMFKFDERTLNGLLTHVGQILPTGNSQHPIWWRPWVKALAITVKRPGFLGRGEDVWPLEWRVFIQKGKIAGISAYYIQAPVRYSDEVKHDLKNVIDQTETLLQFMKDKEIQPWHPRYIGEVEEDDICFSLDFISTENGPAFLEAGPRVPVNEQNIPVREWGAHPCFFIDKPIQGIALSTTEVVNEIT